MKSKSIVIFVTLIVILAGGWLLPQGGYPLLFGAAAGALVLAAGLVMLVRSRNV